MSSSMKNGTLAPGRARITAATLRSDRYLVPNILTVVGLLAWITYATVRVFMQDNFWVEEYEYLTPFYSPCLSVGCGDTGASHF